MLPVAYIGRNLLRRRLRTSLTVGGIALVVAVYFLMGAVAETLVKSFRSTGSAEEVVISQAGAMTVDYSHVDRASLTWVETLEGVAWESERPIVGPELAFGSVVEVGSRRHKVSVRGVSERAPQVYRQVTLAAGEWPAAGMRAAVGVSVAAKLGLEVGSSVRIEGMDWTVRGLLDSHGRVHDQEIWVSLDELAAAANRATYSSYTLRAVDAVAAAALVETVNENRSFPLSAQDAPGFYRRTRGMTVFMAALGRFIATIVAIGAVFGGMNTLYSSVAARRREIAVLRALGYRRVAILAAFVGESLALSLAAGVLGVALGALIAALPIQLPFSAGGAVDLSLRQVTSAFVLSAVIGLVGGVLPALQAARTEVARQLG
jgi:putative ABC transport system permease protein